MCVVDGQLVGVNCVAFWFKGKFGLRRLIDAAAMIAVGVLFVMTPVVSPDSGRLLASAGAAAPAPSPSPTADVQGNDGRDV